MIMAQSLSSRYYFLLAFIGTCMAIYLLFQISVLKGTIQEVISEHEKPNYVKFTPSIEAPIMEKMKNPVPDESSLNSMPLEDLIDFFDGYVTSTQVLCSRRTRIGRVSDGGWDICEDPKYKIDNNDCLVYSFGINNDFDFDDGMEKYGCEVLAFDPSMKAGDHLRGKKVHFYKLGISDRDEITSRNWTVQTLGSFRKKFGHTKRMINVIKMDVEGAELPSLNAAIKEGSLHDVQQFAFEIHVKTNKTPDRKGYAQKDYLLAILGVFRGLWEEGFRLYHHNRNFACWYHSTIHNRTKIFVKKYTCLK